LTKDQSLTPQQQDHHIDGANVEREETSRTGTSAGRAGTFAARSGTSTGRSGTSGRAGTSASRAGTPVQFGGDRAREQEAEQAANQEREVRQFNESQLPHVDKIHRVPPYSNSGMRRVLTRSVRQVTHARLK